MPDAAAGSPWDGVLSYHACRVVEPIPPKGTLAKRGVGPGSAGWRALPRLLDPIVSLVAVLKAGGRFPGAPLSGFHPAHPEERLQFLLQRRRYAFCLQ